MTTTTDGDVKWPTKAEWVAALRSGEYQQGQRYLNGDNKFCCLGVYADLCVKKGIGKWEPRRAKGMNFVVNENERNHYYAALPPGLPPGQIGDGFHYEELAYLNDRGDRDFAAIADVIEQSDKDW